MKTDITPITAEHMRGLQAASSFGHAMQVARDAPTFVGFKVDIDPGSKDKVRTYARNCIR